ncbi:MAG: protein kinase [Deltaproteobacteria bacterium]|nr:protein kinase [Deltaproteobacteria bacterium]
MRLCPKCGKKTQEARCPDDGTATLVLAQNPDAKLVEGTEVNGRYRIGHIIGQGGFGAVYKAKNMATDQDIAIKLLAVSLDSDDSDMIQRFFAEAQVTASLKHPNTIRVFDFGQAESGALYIAMELLSGRPLNEELRDRVSRAQVFREEEVITIGSQVLRSLSEAHLASLVHRDLKPHNIFLHAVEGDDPVVKVLDFGIAKKLGSNMTGTGKAFGTPTYMSPEQAQNKAIDRRSDLYSLGCVLYQLVAGRPPFDGENPLSVLLSHVAEAPPDLRQTARTPISEPFVRVVERAMSKLPEERFGNAMEMRQALEACRGADRSESARMLAVAAAHGVTSQETEAATDGYDAVGTPARTMAYQVASTPRSGEKPIPPPPLGKAPEATVPRAPIVAPTAVSGRIAPASVSQPVAAVIPVRRVSDVAAAQFAFESEAAPDPDPDPLQAPPTAPAKSKAPIVLALAGLAVVAVVAAVLLSGQPDPQAPATASAPVPAAAQPEPTKVAAVAPPAVEPAKAAESAKAAPVETKVSADNPVYVDVVTDPAGADVLMDGKVVGKTPYSFKFTDDAAKTASLHLEGFADKDVEVLARHKPQFKTSLRRLSDDEVKAAEAKKKDGKPKPSGGGKKTGDKGPGESKILEERLD